MRASMLVTAISVVLTGGAGAPVQAFGPHPIGLFIFTADGHFAVNIMRNPPQPNAGA